MYHFPLTAFCIFTCLDFQKLVMMYCDVDSLGLSCLELSQLLEFVHLCLPAKFGKFSVTISSGIFSVPPPFCFPLGNSDHVNVTSLVIVVQSPEALFFVFLIDFIL